MCTNSTPTCRIVLCRFPSLTADRDIIAAVRDATEAFALMKKLIGAGIIHHSSEFSYEYFTTPFQLHNFDVLLEVERDEKCNG